MRQKSRSEQTYQEPYGLWRCCNGQALGGKPRWKSVPQPLRRRCRLYSIVVCFWHRRILNFKPAETQWYDRKLKRILAYLSYAATSQKQNIKWSPSGSRLLGVFKAFVFRKVKQLKIKTSLNDAPTSSRQHDQILWDDVGRCGTMWDDVGRCGTMWDVGGIISRPKRTGTKSWNMTLKSVSNLKGTVALKSVSKPAVGGSPSDPTAHLPTSQLHRPTIRTSKTTTVGSRSTTRHQKHPKTRLQILQRLFIKATTFAFLFVGPPTTSARRLPRASILKMDKIFLHRLELAKGLNPAPLTFHLCVRELWVTEFDFARTTLQDAWMRPSCQLTGKEGRIAKRACFGMFVSFVAIRNYSERCTFYMGLYNRSKFNMNPLHLSFLIMTCFGWQQLVLHYAALRNCYLHLFAWKNLKK